MPAVEHWIVAPEEAGQKLLAFLERRLRGETPRSALHRWIRTGQVRVDGKRAGPHDRIQAGQTIRIPPRRDETVAPPEQASPPLDIPILLDMPILAEEDGLLVLHKPAGLPVQPGTGHVDAVTTRLAAAFPQAVFRPTPAHRLDRDTSGLLLCATSYAMLRQLHDAFRERTLEKTYLAWVRGRWRQEVREETVLEDLLEKRETDGRERMAVGAGRLALAVARARSRREDASLLELDLLTGRTHQLRVQLASRGHPIVGDRKYGDVLPAPGLLLHAWRLRWGDREFLCPPPWSGSWAVASRGAGES